MEKSSNEEKEVYNKQAEEINAKSEPEHIQ